MDCSEFYPTNKPDWLKKNLIW